MLLHGFFNSNLLTVTFIYIFCYYCIVTMDSNKNVSKCIINCLLHNQPHPSPAVLQNPLPVKSKPKQAGPLGPTNPPSGDRDKRSNFLRPRQSRPSPNPQRSAQSEDGLLYERVHGGDSSCCATASFPHQDLSQEKVHHWWRRWGFGLSQEEENYL